MGTGGNFLGVKGQRYEANNLSSFSAEVKITQGCTFKLHFTVQMLLRKLSPSVLILKYVHVYSSGRASKFVRTETKKYRKFLARLDCIYLSGFYGSIYF
jgi:hypothetical protein